METKAIRDLRREESEHALLRKIDRLLEQAEGRCLTSDEVHTLYKAWAAIYKMHHVEH